MNGRLEVESTVGVGSRFTLLLPRRTTFYGATEVGYREPGGHVVTFAQFGGGETGPA